MESTVVENVADKIDASNYSPSEMQRRRPSGKKIYKPQLATTIKWALEDLMERTMAAQRRMRRALERLEELQAMPQASHEVLAQVGRLEHELLGLALDVAELERIAAGAVAVSRPAAKQGKVQASA